MNIRSQKREGNIIFLEIEEDQAGFAAAREKALLKAGREVRIPGFRQGKAPKELIERAVNSEYVESHAAQDLISDLYPQIIDQAKLEPVDFPKIEVVEQKKEKPFVFKIEVEVYPEVTLGKYKGLKVEKEKAEVTEDEVVKVLDNLKQRYAKTSADGKKEELLLDDEFAKKVSNRTTLAELKEEIQTTMLRDRAARVEADVKNKAIAAACADAKFDLPKAMVDREIDVMLDELGSSLAQSNLTLEDYLKGIKKEEAAMREELRKSAEIRVKGKVVLRAISEAEKMEILEKDLEEEFKSMAAASGAKVEELKKNLNEGTRKYMEEFLLRRKALDFILEKAKVKEVEAKKVEEEKK